MPPRTYKVGVLLFDRVDILDVAGPIEILSHASHNKNPDVPDRMFWVVTIARDRTIRAGASLPIQADMFLDEVQLPDFDILLVPGGPPSAIRTLIDSDAPELGLVREYAALPPDPDPGRERLLFSVCTGALLLGAAGVLDGVTVATHHRGLDLLRDVSDRANSRDAKSPTVVHRRYVDGGVLKPGLRLLTAGGVSSGLDAALYLVGQLAGQDIAGFIGRVMEYEWRGPDAGE
ncbi:ThiJ PfpI family protein [Aspergillus sp. HF37]|nr:ThiJ PfpI family protein [Aspergillus sp. HF37]